MTREEVFEAWAPAGVHWSEWAKPVLFAQMPRGWANEAGVEAPEVSVEAVAVEGAAIVLDLPGEAGVWYAMALAGRGWRPVPLYNGAANGSYSSLGISSIAQLSASIDMWGIMRGLWEGAAELRSLPLGAEALPVFMLDSRRRLGERGIQPGIFDNRWISFPTDFPSAAYLKEHGVGRVVVVSTQGEVANDLSHTLLRWQQAGIEVSGFQVDVDAGPRAITIRRPSLFGAAWYQFVTTLGFRRRLLGGFGGTVPNVSSGG